MRFLRPVSTFVIAALVLLAAQPGAHAHARLVRAQPAAGTSVKAAPAELVLWFSEALEPAFCRVEVTDAAGKRVDQGTASVDAADRKILHVAVAPLAAGAYSVVWHVVSIDTHPEQGKFSFEVQP